MRPAFAYLAWSLSLCALTLSDGCSSSIVSESHSTIKASARIRRNKALHNLPPSPPPTSGEDVGNEDDELLSALSSLSEVIESSHFTNVDTSLSVASNPSLIKDLWSLALSPDDASGVGEDARLRCLNMLTEMSGLSEKAR